MLSLGSPVTKSLACVRKRYLKGLVVLTAQKIQKKHFFSSREDFPGKAVLVQVGGEAVPTSAVPQCLLEVKPTSKAVQSLHGHFWQRDVHAWQEFSLVEKPPCLSM